MERFAKKSETDSAIDLKVDKVIGYSLSQENFSTIEKSKLSTLSNLFKGTFTSEANLIIAYPTGAEGWEALVDEGVGTDAIKYIWDLTDGKWVQGGGSGASTFADLTGDPLDNGLLAIALNSKAILPNELISGGITTIESDDVTVGPVSWRINGTVYVKAIATSFDNIANSANGKQRYIAFYGNTSSSINKVEGAELNLAVMPTSPPDTALISYVLVGDGGIGEPSADLSGFATNADVGDKTLLTANNRLNLVEAINEVTGTANSLESDQITLKIFKISNYGTL